MKESTVVSQIKKHLEDLGHIVFKYHGSPWSVNGFADLHGHLVPSGRAFYIEVKQPGKKPRQDQLAFLNRMHESGALAFWTDNLQDVDNHLLSQYII